MSRARTLWLIIAVWSVPAVLLTVSRYLFATSPRGGGALFHAFLLEGLPWAIWVLVTPLVLRQPAEPADLRGRGLVAHIARAIGVALVFGIVSGLFGHAAFGTAYADDLVDALRMGAVDWLPFQMLVYGGVVCAGIAISSARRRRAAELGKAQLETQLAYAQLSALRAQLQPHFLFNTLNAAVALARAGDAAGTAHVLVQLGELLRQLLRRDAPQEVPLRDELALLETYLDIQRVRFGDRLQVAWDVPDEVRDALVPQLVLQPLVENALQHGISRRSRAGRLDIAAVRRGDQLHLTVCDDGPGVAPSFSLADATGVGLRNTRERLQRLYGERGALGLTTAGERTTAVIELPIHTEALGG